MEQNKKQEKAISHTGCHIFDGTLSFKMGGKDYKVRCEYHGLDLQRASQEHQIVMLIKQHLPYDEIDTGWLVRTKNLDKEHRFGLKARKNDRTFAVYDYNDVVAWGYADGGLNSDHFDSCRLRPEDYPEFAVSPDDDVEDEDDWGDDSDVERRCVKFKVTDKDIIYDAVMGKDDMMKDGGTPLMHACAKVFYEFRKEHPEVTEMHFYTDELVKMEEEEGE